MAHVWTSLSPLPGIQGGSVHFVPDTMLLLTDGSVLVHQRMNEHLPVATGMEWFRLRPDAAGKYESGTWSGPFNMRAARQYFSSGMLRDGRIFVLGGEYSTSEPLDASGNAVDTATGEIFDPVSNTWSDMTKPATYDWVRRDAAACVLADGRVLFGAAWSNRSAVWNPVAGTWQEAGLAFGTAAAPTKVGNGDEETWTLLPDGSVLTVNIDRLAGGVNVTAAPASEKYIPATDTWVSAGHTRSDLSFRHGYKDPATGLSTGDVFEIGPAIVLPDGRLFAIGATGHTALYTPPSHPSHAGSWSSGPDLPLDANGNVQLADDMPAALLPSGHVLLIGGPANVAYNTDASGKPTSIKAFWISPLVAFLYDPVTNATPVSLAPQPPVNQGSGRLLLLPTGQVLYSCEVADALSLLTLDATLLRAPNPAWQPVIVDCPTCMVAGDDYVVSGLLFNGLSQACSFGDDAQMATNYPIVRLTDSANHVVYARTSAFSTLGIATGASPVSTHVRVPVGTPPGRYQLEVIANGIASDPIDVEIATVTCLHLSDPRRYVAVDPLSLVLRNDIYIRLHLPDPPPIDVLERELRNAVKEMSAKERDSARAKVKAFVAMAHAMEKALR